MNIMSSMMDSFVDGMKPQIDEAITFIGTIQAQLIEIQNNQVFQAAAIREIADQLAVLETRASLDMCEPGAAYSDTKELPF